MTFCGQWLHLMSVLKILMRIGNDLRAEHPLHLNGDRTGTDTLTLIGMDGLYLDDFGFESSIFDDLYDLTRKVLVSTLR